MMPEQFENGRKYDGKKLICKIFDAKGRYLRTD